MMVNDLLPRPRALERLPGPPVRITRGWVVEWPREIPGAGSLACRAAAIFAARLGGEEQHFLQPVSATTEGRLLLRILLDGVADMGACLLEAGGNEIVIRAASTEGICHALSTLEQLCHGGPGDFIEIPAGKIEDSPAFGWRGMHLDCARHFFPVGFLRKFIDTLSLYKFNRLHLHLSDDQGWRVEIKGLPRLTEVGAWRDGTLAGHLLHEPLPHEFTPGPYGGCYTADELRELVAYASARGITIVPEIDIPGHATAIIAAYPELSCRKEKVEVAREWGIWRHLLCAGSDAVLGAMRTIIDELLEIFPSPWIHLGGDECPTTYWERCPACQARIRVENLGGERGLHGWFMKQMASHVTSRGRTPVGWDEVLEGGVDLGKITVTGWRGDAHTLQAASLGYPAINCNCTFTYFDYYQVEETKGEPLAIGGFTSLEKVYSFDPVPPGLAPQDRKYILGAQGQLWSEYLPTPERVEYAAFPRMLALAEVLWTGPDPGRWPGFLARLPSHFSLLDSRGIRSCKHGY